METQLMRQKTPPLFSETNGAFVETWKRNRKRLRDDEDSYKSMTGRRDADTFQSKLKKHNDSLYKDRFSQINYGTSFPITTERPLLPLCDITHQTQEPESSRTLRLTASEMRGRQREAQRNFTPTSSSPNPDTGVTNKTPHVLEKSGDITVTYVNNLFSPVSKLQAIPLSLDELRRRTEYPESFGRSELVSYLRHSKTTGNELLAKYELKPTSDRSRLNVLSRLCEREATTLANGIHKMNNEYFPMAYVADTMKEQLNNEKQESTLDEKSDALAIGNTKETIRNTMDLLESLKKILKDPEEDLAQDLEIFEKATHTFGCQNILNHISFFESYLEELEKKV